MLRIFCLFAAATLSLSIVCVANVPAEAAAPGGACELTTAVAVSAAVGQAVMQTTTAASPKSLCSFNHFAADGRVVKIGLFNAATMTGPKIGGVLSQFGCRTTIAECQKALADRSPGELYALQPPGSAPCTQTPKCLITSNGVVWAMQGADVVAIFVVVAGTPPDQTMALAVLKTLGSSF
jgi:hypothetical protein